MPFTAKGRLHDIFDTQQVSENFRKREFVLEIEDGRYPQHVKFQLTQDKSDIIDAYQIGQEVEVTFDLRGRPSVKSGVTTYFTNLEAWKIQPLGNAPALGGQAARQPATQQQARPAAQPIASDDDNDLPF